MKKILPILLLLLTCNVSAQKAASLNKKAAELGSEGYYNEALQTLDQAAEKYNITSARAYHNKGYILELQGNVDEAIKSYEQAIKHNPKQVDSIERVGYWSYKRGDYTRAVELGEKVLKLDPRNADVRKWLPEAYKLKLQNPIIDKDKDKTAEVKKETPKSLLEKAEEEEKKLKVPFMMLGLDIGFRFSTTADEYDKLPDYEDSPGKIINIPYNAYGWYKVSKNFQLNFKLSHPYYGATIPNTVSQEEFIEAVFQLKKFKLGAGILVSHYYDDFNFNKEMSLTDFKIGGVFAYTGEEGTTQLSFYPRLLPLDTEATTLRDNTFDTGFIELRHTYTASDSLSYYTKISENDFYYFDHKNEISNYYGFIELGFGLTLDNQNNLDAKSVSFSIEFCRKFIYYDLLEEKPYTVLNGSGFFGYDLGNNNINSYQGSSDILRFMAKEMIDDTIFVSQRVMLEFVDRNFESNEFIISLGAGVIL